jgi:dihydrofolate reductase
MSGHRKITVNLYMTLDGFGEWPEYPGSSFQEVDPSLMFHEMWISRYDDVDTVLFGRRSFEGHASRFRGSGLKPDDPPYIFDYGRFLDRCQKVVVSKTLQETDWANTRFVAAPLEQVVAQLKSEPGKDIIVDGGPSIVQEFIAKDLADDYRMGVWPVIYGRGLAYWPARKDQQRTLRLVSMKSLSYGELVLHYERVR